MLTQKKLLAVLKANGYTGGPDLVVIKSFIAEKNLNLRDGEGNAIDIDKAFALPEVKTVTIIGNDEAGFADDDVELVGAGTKSAKASADSIRAKSGQLNAGIEAPAIRSPHTRFKMLYNHRAKMGQTAFYDADMAEEFGAFIRKTTMDLVRRDYATKTADGDILTKAGSTTVNSTGGALVAPEFVAQLIWLTEQYGVARQIANVVNMGTTDNTIFPRKSAIGTATFIAENGTMTAQDDTFGNINLVPKLCYMLARYSNALLEDSQINLGENYAKSFAEAYAILMDQCFILGDGSATYGNFVGLDNAAQVTTANVTASGATFETVTIADFTKLFGTIQNASPNANLMLIMTRQAYSRMCVRLAIQSSGNTEANYTNGAIVNGLKTDARFMGFPVKFAQVMPTAGTTGQKVAYFGDFASGSMIGERRALSITTSDQRYFDQDQFAIRGTARFAVNIHGDGRTNSNGPIARLTLA